MYLIRNFFFLVQAHFGKGLSFARELLNILDVFFLVACKYKAKSLGIRLAQYEVLGYTRFCQMMPKIAKKKNKNKIKANPVNFPFMK